MEIKVTVFEFVFADYFTPFFENQAMVEEVKMWCQTEDKKWDYFCRLMEDSLALWEDDWEENFRECYVIAKEKYEND